MIYFIDYYLADDARDLHNKLADLYASVGNFNYKHDVIAVCCVKEMISVQKLADNVENGIRVFLRDRDLPEHCVWLIVNNTVGKHAQTKNLHSRISQFDYFACWCYHRHMIYDHPTNTQWNLNADKALFLMGKPYKNHRIGVLYHLTQLPCAEHLVYSFHPGLGTETESMTAEVFSEHCENTTYRDFAEKYQHTLDLTDDVKIIGDDGIYHYTGFPYDHRLYENSVVSVISETHFNGSQHGPSQRWITEKTWHAVLNRSPFVLFDGGELHNYLERLGIETFQKYYKHSVRDIGAVFDSGDVDGAMRMCAENVCEFLTVRKAHSDEIFRITQHNFGVAEQYYHDVLAEHFDNNIDLYDEFFRVCEQSNL